MSTDTAQAPNAAAAPAAKKLQTNHGHITGKINTKRKIKTSTGTLHLTVLKLPSADSFSHPSTVELRSNFDLGVVDEEWSGYVRLAGMPNNYDTKRTDDDGEIVKEHVRSARNEYVVLDTN